MISLTWTTVLWRVGVWLNVSVLGVAPQPAAPSGYVSSNPVLWLTRTNSKYAPNYLSLVSGMIGEADSMTNSDEKPTGHFNVVAMIDKVICTSFRVLGIPRIQRIILD